jgi:hypothetical protein
MPPPTPRRERSAVSSAPPSALTPALAPALADTVKSGRALPLPLPLAEPAPNTAPALTRAGLGRPHSGRLHPGPPAGGRPLSAAARGPLRPQPPLAALTESFDSLAQQWSPLAQRRRPLLARPPSAAADAAAGGSSEAADVAAAAGQDAADARIAAAIRSELGPPQAPVATAQQQQQQQQQQQHRPERTGRPDKAAAGLRQFISQQRRTAAAASNAAGAKATAAAADVGAETDDEGGLTPTPKPLPVPAGVPPLALGRAHDAPAHPVPASLPLAQALPLDGTAIASLVEPGTATELQAQATSHHQQPLYDGVDDEEEEGFDVVLNTYGESVDAL